MPKHTNITSQQTQPTQPQPVFKVASYSMTPVKPLDLPKRFTNTNPLYVHVKSRVNSWR